MKKDNFKYSFEIRPLSEDDGGGYLITFPSLPGCMSDGETVNEAIENGMDAVECWLKVAKERGQHIPEPKTKYSGQFVQRIPKSMHARLAAFAKHEGVSMNTLVAQFISEGLTSADLKPYHQIIRKHIEAKNKRMAKPLSDIVRKRKPITQERRQTTRRQTTRRQTTK